MISFIIPVFNCENYLYTCLHSIMKVSTCYEVILINDGSTDSSGEICNELAETYKEVYCVHQQNQGVSVARNYGLRLARGEYILFLDADDSVEIEKLNELLKVIEKDDSIDMAVFGLSFDFYYQGLLYRRDELNTPLVGKQKSEQWIQGIPELYAANSLSPIWNKIIKRSILSKNGLELCKDMFIYEDLEYSLRTMSFCENIYFEPEIIYHYRQSEDEGNASKRLKRIEKVSTLIYQIETALDMVLEKQSVEIQNKAKSILLKLYMVLAREKISISNIKDIEMVCSDFFEWFNNRNGNVQIPKENEKFVRQLLDKKIISLIVRRNYITIRHKIAVIVKNTRVYQRWKG